VTSGSMPGAGVSRDKLRKHVGLSFGGLFERRTWFLAINSIWDTNRINASEDGIVQRERWPI
jgi:hypothetical protein